MIKEIKIFLYHIMQTYPVYAGNDEKKVINDTAKYILKNLDGKNVDFEKAKNLLFAKYERKSFPTPSELMNFLNKSVIVETNPEINDGTWYLLTLPSGTKYAFTPAPFGKTCEELEEEFKKNYNDFTFEKFDDNTAIIGNKLCTFKNGKWGVKG